MSAFHKSHTACDKIDFSTIGSQHIRWNEQEYQDSNMPRSSRMNFYSCDWNLEHTPIYSFRGNKVEEWTKCKEFACLESNNPFYVSEVTFGKWRNRWVLLPPGSGTNTKRVLNQCSELKELDVSSLAKDCMNGAPLYNYRSLRYNNVDYQKDDQVFWMKEHMKRYASCFWYGKTLPGNSIKQRIGIIYNAPDTIVAISKKYDATSYFRQTDGIVEGNGEWIQEPIYQFDGCIKAAGYSGLVMESPTEEPPTDSSLQFQSPTDEAATNNLLQSQSKNSMMKDPVDTSYKFRLLYVFGGIIFLLLAFYFR